MQVTCIIPAFDEEVTIGQVVAGALRYCHMVLVVDDNSQDRTAEVSRQAGAKVIRHLVRLGVGGALSTGLRAALKTVSQVLVTMDGDGQHNPQEIPLLIDPISRGEADIVVGSRLLKKSKGMPFAKKLGNKVLSIATSFASGTQITDSQSGFRAYRREVLEYAIHRAWDYAWASEIFLLAAKAKFRIKEVPITPIYLPRQQRGADIKDGLKILYSMMKHR